MSNENNDALHRCAPVHEAEAAGEAALVLRRIHGNVVVDALVPAQPCTTHHSNVLVLKKLQALGLRSHMQKPVMLLSATLAVVRCDVQLGIDGLWCSGNGITKLVLCPCYLLKRANCFGAVTQRQSPL